MAAIHSLHPPGSPPAAIHTGPPRAVLIDPAQRLHGLLAPGLAGLGLSVGDDFGPSPFDADVIVIDIEGAPLALDGARAARTGGRDLTVIGVIGWWSEHDPDARRGVDIVLHAPLRLPEVEQALRMLAARLSSRLRAG